MVRRLVEEEHYGLAAYVTKRWGLPGQVVWERWAHSLIMWVLRCFPVCHVIWKHHHISWIW